MSVISGPQGTGAAAAASYAPRFKAGFALTRSSATQIVVDAGNCRDKNDSEDIDLAADTTVDITTINAAAGLERKTLTATAARTSGSASVTFSANIASEFTSRALTGTWSGASTTLTGTGTKALSQLAVGDLVGSATTGWSRVTAIASDVSVTIVAALPTAAASTSTLNVLVENAAATAIAGTTKTLDTLTGNGLTGVYASTWGVTDSGQAVTFGDEVASAWYAVWASNVSAAGTAFLSSQRTTPLGSITGYTAARRLGFVRNDSSGDIFLFRNPVEGFTSTTRSSAMASGNNATYTDVICSDYAPPSAHAIVFEAWNFKPNGGTSVSLFVQPRGGAAVEQVPCEVLSGDIQIDVVTVPCDGAQVVQYKLSAAGNSPATLNVVGYLERPS